MTGIEEASGLGEPVALGEDCGKNSLSQSVCRTSNFRLLSKLKETDRGEELLAIARKDARKGRMTEPRPIEVRECECVFSLCVCWLVRSAIWARFYCTHVLLW